MKLVDIAERIETFLYRITGNLNKVDYRKTYARHIQSLKRRYPLDQAMRLAIGGDFEAIGKIERDLLAQYGLRKEDFLIDVGCGSGRLAKPLSAFLAGRYLGIDIIKDLTDYARTITQRPDWRFEVTQGLNIPAPDTSADYVCFFSVFTHLLHEQSYIYLQEAKRVLKPGGRILFSFFEFENPSHWTVFEWNVRDVNVYNNPINMFIGRDAIREWASRLGLSIEHMIKADDIRIRLSEPVQFDNGISLKESSGFGQSICILQKKS